MQPRDDERSFWERIAAFGIPQQVTLEDAATNTTLVDVEITATKSTESGGFDIEGCRSVEAHPLTGSMSGALSPRARGSVTTMMSTMSTTGSGEHIGWIVSPKILQEVQQVVNEIGSVCGEFTEHDFKGGVVVDWYQRASEALGTTTLNSLTRVREILKALIAQRVLPADFEAGSVPPRDRSRLGARLAGGVR